MPEIKNLTVHVTDRNGFEFEEWGVQHLRGQRKISAYIKSSSDMAFQVTIKPNIPFIDPDDPTYHRSSKMDEVPGVSMNSDPDVDYYDSANRTTESSSYLRNLENTQSQSPPPFHLLASLYLDGRQEPERRLIVYLDPEHEDFPIPKGKFKFKHRCVQAKDDTTKELAWIFRDVGVEKVFGKMSIEGPHDEARQPAEQNEDAMVTLMDSAGLGFEGDFRREELRNVGQIQVVLQRVSIGQRWYDRNYRPKHQEHEMEDVNLDGIKNDITHTAGFEYASTLPSQPTSVIHFCPYVEGEPPYATFQFFYRNQDVLERFGFPGFPRSIKSPPKARRQLDGEISNLTPLSIAHPIKSAKRKGTTFEEKIQRKSFDPKVEPKYKFHEKYREVAAFSEKDSISQQQKPLSSDPSLCPVVEQTTSFMSSEKSSIEPSQDCVQKDMPYETISISFGKSVTTPQQSLPTIQSKSILPNDISALNYIPKIYRKANHESDADDERDSDKENNSGDDDVLSQEDGDLSTRDQDDYGLHTRLREIVICRKRHYSDEDFNSSTQATAGSLTTNSSVALSEDGEICEEPTSFLIEPTGFHEKSSPNIASQRTMIQGSKRFKRGAS